MHSLCIFFEKTLDLECTPTIKIKYRGDCLTIKQVSEIYNISQDTLRYYEKVGMIPTVNRNRSGIRDYTEQDLDWVQMAICMRSAGLPVDVMIKYLKLYQQGDETFKQRLELLKNQYDKLLKQREQINQTLEKLDYKISRYEIAVKTGKLSWD